MTNIANNTVSVIMPAYNSERFIETAILSVLEQSYQDFELIVIDDASTDRTKDIVHILKKKDKRIQLVELEENLGAANARNCGLNIAKGRYIAFLDADDFWRKNKNETQVNFMKEYSVGFSCTSYEVVSEEGKALNKKITMKSVLDYKGFLQNNLIQTVGVMIDRNYVSDEFIIMPNLERRQDAATWLKILKSGVECYGIEDSLGYYRRVGNSLSSNKIKSAKGVWYLYREIEKLPLLFSCLCFISYATLAVYKRVYIFGGKNDKTNL